MTFSNRSASCAGLPGGAVSGTSHWSRPESWMAAWPAAAMADDPSGLGVPPLIGKDHHGERR